MDNDLGMFNHAEWSATSEIMLCNVRWDATYKDLAYFKDTNALNTYLDNLGEIVNITNASYARVSEPISVNIPFGRAQRYNYVRVYNDAQPVPGNDVPRYYYYFIRDVRHVNPGVTEIIVQLDVWQTYIRQIEFGRAYVERGHIGVANKKNFDSFGRDYLSIKEGLDTGSDYVTVYSKDIKVMDPFDNGNEPTFNVMAITTVDLNGDFGTEDKPKTPAPKPSYFQGDIPSGAGVYVWDNAKDFMTFLADFSKKSWATTGIVSLTLLPPQQRWFKYGFAFGAEKDPKTLARPGYVTGAVRYNMLKNWRESPVINNFIPERYRHLKKFLTSPYCLIELTYNAGSTVVLKPEAWNSPDASVMEKLAVIPPSQRLGAIPLNYNGRAQTPDDEEGAIPSSANWYRSGDYLDMAVFLSGFPTIPIVNNGQIMALANQARSIAAQYSGLDWAQQRAMAGSQLSYDQATQGINAGIDMANIGMSADQQQTAISNNLASSQALLNMFGGAASGAGMGAFAGPMGAVAGGVGGLASGGLGMLSTGMQIDASNQALASRLGSSGASRDVSSGLGAYMRDSNLGYANAAAQGDYANARSALDARIQDTQVVQNGTSGQFGGEMFNLVNDDMNLTIRFKMIDQASIAVVGEFWLRYGYPVRRPMKISSDLRVMSKFSYWKMTEVYIVNGAMPETHKMAIKGIMESGFTMWSNPDDIGAVDFADNQPLDGITIDGYNPPAWEPEETPEPPVKKKRKKRNMIVFATNEAGVTKYALAGASPGTPANFLKTDSATLGLQYMTAAGVAEPVMLPVSDFYEMENKFLLPVSTLEFTEGA